MDESQLEQVPDIENIEDILDGNREMFMNSGNEDSENLNRDLMSELKRKRYEDTTKLRQSLANAFTVIIALWLLSIILILVGNSHRYFLSENVLITLLTTTTIQVLGMMLIILWDLFPGKKRNRNNQN